MKMVVFRDNWADEMDVEGIRFFADDEWEDAKIFWQKIFEEDGCWDWYCGTNQYIKYSSFDDLISNMRVREISKKEYGIHVNVFGHYFGAFPYWD